MQIEELVSSNERLERELSTAKEERLKLDEMMDGL